MREAAKASVVKGRALYGTREEWLNAFLFHGSEEFQRVNAPLPAVRVSIGFTSKGLRGKAIGECWCKSCADDGVFEIFVNPNIQEPMRIADVVTHELVHAAVGIEAKHGRKFYAVATNLGLEGKMTATVGGPEWRRWAEPVVEALGRYPAGKFNPRASSLKPKQSTRMLKCECQECGFTFRTTAKWLDVSGRGLRKDWWLRCPVSNCNGVVEVEDSEQE